MIPETFNIEVYTFTSVGFVIKKRWLRFVQTELQHYFHIRYLHFVRYLDVFLNFSFSKRIFQLLLFLLIVF